MASSKIVARAQPQRASKAKAQARPVAKEPDVEVDRVVPSNPSKRGSRQPLDHGDLASGKRKNDEPRQGEAGTGQRPFKKARTGTKSASANAGAPPVVKSPCGKTRTGVKHKSAEAEAALVAKTRPKKAKAGTLRTSATAGAVPAPKPPGADPGTSLVINQPPTRKLAVLVFGNGDNGELGLGPRQAEALAPRSNPFFDPKDPSQFHVVQLACGGMHTIALTANNKIITWGVNDENALGRDTHWDEQMRDASAGSDDDDAELNPLESTPTEISPAHFPPNTRFVQVAAADNCSLALTDTGLVYGWGTFRDPEGNRCFGHDMDGTVIQNQKTPILVQGLERITQITCGANHALALDVSGSIWAWGSNSQKQFGRRLFGRHQESPRPRLVRVCRNNASYIASGEYHAFAIDRKDNVWAWGLNSYGEAGYAKTAGSDSALLPYPTKVPDLCGRGVIALSGGAHHSAAVTADGQCLVWGRLDGGQLGIRFTTEQLQDAARIRYDERNKPRICLRPTAVPNIGKACHVACGTEHTIFINQDGKVFTTGLGSGGQLGLGSEDDLEVAQHVRVRELKGGVVAWAGAGGQFSVVAGPA